MTTDQVPTDQTSVEQEPELQAVSASRVAWAIARQEPVAYVFAMVLWVTFHSLPVAGGVLLKVVLDRVQLETGSARLAVGALLALAVVEVGRWAVFMASVIQWHGVWVHWHTVPRLHMLRSLLGDPGPTAGRLPGSPGEAVSRFRDDPRNTALLADVWLDLAGAGTATLLALVVLARIDVAVTGVMLLPVLGAVLFTRSLAPRLKHLRQRERTATAAVTGFIGDTFGAITAVKAAGAEAAVERRFRELGDGRAQAALLDQVATQVVHTLSGATGNLSTGLALLVLAPALLDGRATVGDVGLFASAAITMATLPRQVARLGTHQRQGEVSVQRMGRLLAPGADHHGVGAPMPTSLRHGPAALPARPLSPPDRPAADRLRTLQVRGLVVVHPDGTRVGPVDLDVTAGSLTVVTGPVGAGKSSVLRAMLGLLPIADGEIRWNGALVTQPSLEMVPPRVAYLPQAPRLFSETLAETILLGVEDHDLAEALRIACLEPDLTRMPHGLRTPVGPRGVRLSGGQVQRAGAARAITRRPDLLVIDDLSSALDVRTEAQVWNGLIDRPDRPALLVVTHRRPVRARADRVVTLAPSPAASES